MSRQGLTSDTCAICFESMNWYKLRGLLPCNHCDFCYACIFNWSLSVNTCPLCKARFYLIQGVFKNHSELTLSNQVIKVQNTNLKPETLERPYVDVSCEVCGSDLDEELMLLCDECDRGFHTTCINLHSLPECELWFCDSCISLQPYSVQKEVLQAILKVKLN